MTLIRVIAEASILETDDFVKQRGALARGAIAHNQSTVGHARDERRLAAGG